jgi:hypothetical protein
MRTFPARVIFVGRVVPQESQHKLGLCESGIFDPVSENNDDVSKSYMRRNVGLQWQLGLLNSSVYSFKQSPRLVLEENKTAVPSSCM